MATVRRKAGTRLLTGNKEIDQILQTMEVGAANKIARPALTKGARILLKAQKVGVPPDKKYIKRALGMRVDAKGGATKDQPRAKVGAGVGNAAKASKKRETVDLGKGTNTKIRRVSGVGISGRNIHWALLGTESRTTDAGKSTGAMPPQVPGLIKDATTAAMPEVKAAIRDEAKRKLAALAVKK